jgi:hypothetical protein
MSVASGNYVAISLNKSSTGHKVVTLIFNGNPKHLIEDGAGSMIEGAGIESLVNSKGETPMGYNMWALLNCHGGTLLFRNEKYNIQVESVEKGKSDLEIFVLMTLLVSWMFHTKYFV